MEQDTRHKTSGRVSADFVKKRKKSLANMVQKQVRRLCCVYLNIRYVNIASLTPLNITSSMTQHGQGLAFTLNELIHTLEQKDR